MNGMPLVSIVIPTYNQAEYIAETIQCLLNQEYRNIELIVVDDGSTDNTAEILSGFKSNIKIIHQPNSGQSSAINNGWALCKGDLLGYLSSDDLLVPQAVSKIVDFILRDSGIVCAYPNSNLIDEKSKVTKARICKKFDLVDTLIKQECWIGPGALFRRGAYEKLGGWNTTLKLAPDREFWIRVSGVGKIEMLDECLAGYRLHSTSISYKEISETTSCEYIRVLDEYFQSKNVPEWAMDAKNEAYGYAYLIVARNCFRSGKIKRGLQIYRKACELNPTLLSIAVRFSLFRTSLSKPLRVALARMTSVVKKTR